MFRASLRRAKHPQKVAASKLPQLALRPSAHDQLTQQRGVTTSIRQVGDDELGVVSEIRTEPHVLRTDQTPHIVDSVATLDIKLFRIPAAKYLEAKQFFDQVLDDGNQKIILLSNNALTKL